MSIGYYAIFWLVVAVMLIVVESVSVQLFCIWFAVGAVFALVASFFGVPFWVQLLVFLISSVAALIIGRPILAQRIKPRNERTNADRVIGQIAVVRDEVDNVIMAGRVYANGLDWAAVSHTGEKIPAGSKVRVLGIDGVKLIVEQINEENSKED